VYVVDAFDRATLQVPNFLQIWHVYGKQRAHFFGLCKTSHFGVFEDKMMYGLHVMFNVSDDSVDIKLSRLLLMSTSRTSSLNFFETSVIRRRCEVLIRIATYMNRSGLQSTTARDIGCLDALLEAQLQHGQQK
jgi:hypothetical protein